MDTYKLRKLRKDKGSEDYDAASLAVPMEIARILPSNVRFRPELTDDGLLYRPVEEATQESGDLPGWLKQEEPTKTTAATAKSK